MIRRIVWGLVLLGAVYFTVQAGEFSTLDILRQRNRKSRLQAQVDSLQKQVDSLKRVEHDVRMDPVVQERIAREEFGLVRGTNEILYRFATPATKPDSAQKKK